MTGMTAWTGPNFADRANVERIRVREDTLRALRGVYGDAVGDEADALLDQLETVGLRLVRS